MQLNLQSIDLFIITDSREFFCRSPLLLALWTESFPAWTKLVIVPLMLVHLHAVRVWTLYGYAAAHRLQGDLHLLL